MKKIVVLQASVRTGRNSDRVAKYFLNYLRGNNLAEAELVDLAEENFPLFDERLRFMSNPSEQVKSFAERINAADGIIIVTPEYNGGYPASLKNAIDLLYDEWRGKPVALACVSSGDFGGSQVVQQLLFVLWKIGAIMVPAKFHVTHVADSYSEDGTPANRERSDKQAAAFTKELMHLADKLCP